MGPAPLNYALYQAGWLACVLGAARGAPLAGAGMAMALVALHLGLARCRSDEIRLVLAAAALGTAVDSAQQAAGLLAFPAGGGVAWLCPVWITVLWAQLATTLHFCLGWLARRPGLAAVLGAVGGPLAFRAGAALGAVSFPAGQGAALLSLAAVWSGALPLLAWLAGRWREPEAGRYLGLSRGNQGKKALVRRA